jgi:hypothetical protein
MNDNQKFLDTAATAEYLGVSAETLKGWRSRGMGPPFRKLPNAKVSYRRADLDRFNEQHIIDPSRAA